jgi:hypothetical protein
VLLDLQVNNERGSEQIVSALFVGESIRDIARFMLDPLFSRFGSEQTAARGDLQTSFRSQGTA